VKFSELQSKTIEQEIALDGCILCIKSGSGLYGTRTENSDDDAIGIFIEPLDYRFGRKHVETVEFKTHASNSGQRNSKGDLDVTLHSLDKFIGLAENNNPTICELFFPPQNCILHITDLGKRFLKSYEFFISKRLYHSLRGYAYQQLDRNKLKSGNNNGRKDLIDKWGFDVKLVSHAVRLYMEAIELLGTGELSFPLKENQKLIDIKSGLWTFEQCMEECEKLKTLVDQVYATSTIRHTPDHNAIHDLQVEMYKEFYNF
jgi:uncharacterized protein